MNFLEFILSCWRLQDSLREAHEDAMRKAISAFNASAVGAGAARTKFEKLLHSSLKKAFEVTLLLPSTAFESACPLTIFFHVNN